MDLCAAHCVSCLLRQTVTCIDQKEGDPPQGLHEVAHVLVAVDGGATEGARVPEIEVHRVEGAPDRHQAQHPRGRHERLPKPAHAVLAYCVPSAAIIWLLIPLTKVVVPLSQTCLFNMASQCTACEVWECLLQMRSGCCR